MLQIGFPGDVVDVHLYRLLVCPAEVIAAARIMIVFGMVVRRGRVNLVELFEVTLQEMFVTKSPPTAFARANKITAAEMSHVGVVRQRLFLRGAGRYQAKQKISE
jgi:hypothetical protein